MESTVEELKDVKVLKKKAYSPVGRFKEKYDRSVAHAKLMADGSYPILDNPKRLKKIVDDFEAKKKSVQQGGVRDSEQKVKETLYFDDIPGDIVRYSEQKGISDGELAKKTGLAKSTLSEFLSGKTKQPSYRLVCVIMAVLGGEVRCSVEVDVNSETGEVSK